MAAEPDEEPVPDISGIAGYVTARADEQANWHAERVLATQNQSWASLILQG